MSREQEFEEDAYVDVRSLPLRPPQPAPQPDRPVRRPWHPVMWDDSIAGIVSPTADVVEEKRPLSKEYPHKQRIRNLKRLIAEGKVKPSSETKRPLSKEYPHKQRIRNLKRLIAEGKVKPSSETVIFFLCNKFAISKERQSKLDIK